ncbi:hypothetical protein QQ045_032748 [Rhodiola kirilowii]
MDSIDKSSIATNTASQAAAYARLAEAAAKLKMKLDTEGDKQYDDPGLFSVLPVSAESAGLLPKHKGSPHDSEILLEAIIEAESHPPRLHHCPYTEPFQSSLSKSAISTLPAPRNFSDSKPATALDCSEKPASDLIS